jgi:predicted MPP superfamily phosphohydrolase
VWAVGIEPRLLDEAKVEAQVPRLPPGWEGERIAAFGDLQVGVWYANTGTTRRAVECVLRERPAAVLLLGDYLYHPAPDRRDALLKVQCLLAPLGGAGIPAYAVLGNHDYGLDDGGTPRPAEMAESVRKMLREVGIRVLGNEAVELPAPGGQDAETLWLAGISSPDGEGDDPARALRTIPQEAPRIVMMHNPHSFQGLPPGAAPFATAAHTHGAQVRIPFLSGRSWLARKERQPAHISGWATPEFGAEGNRLYVNRGIGFSALPVRFNARPELTFLRLTRG